VHKAYASLMEGRPDLAKAMNGVILYGLCKCDAGTGLAAVKRLSELPEEWTAAARVNASAFLYQKVVLRWFAVKRVDDEGLGYICLHTNSGSVSCNVTGG
jgi:hypothetical protein